MSIDVHAHVVPAQVIATLERDGHRYGVEALRQDGLLAVRVAGDGPWPVRGDLVDVGRRLAAMDRAGVSTQTLSSWINLTAYTLDGTAGPRFCRMFNEALAGLVEAHPGRFLALASAPLQAPQRAAAELRHAVGRLGMVGVEIGTTVAGTELDDPGLEPFWAAAEELGAIVLVHPMDPLAGRGVTRYFLGNAVGRPAETTIAVAHLILGGVLERFRQLRVCVVHGGGFLPYQRGRLDRAYLAKPELAAANLTQAPSVWLRHLYYDTVVHDPGVLAWLIDFVGAHHVLLGSDYPFEMGDPDPVRTVRSVPGLDEHQRHLILRGNLERLVGTGHGAPRRQDGEAGVEAPTAG
ncbi:MAG TPA: amidohydrolase family protein [Actinomycetes bacterium]|nr:amidohydrolase family protein [Actinomycetes bacterium]